jgi:Rrf2 family transcriptional regulator, cysteine metabolism repressor
MEASGPMKISAKAEYACLALLALAQQGPDGPPVRIREISGTHGIPERYLVQILLQLKGAGLVVSTRGALGGYRLARPAAKIALSEVLAVIDGPETAQRGSAREKLPAARILGRVWDRVRAAEQSVLDTTTIAELAAQTSPHEWTI